MVEFEFSKLATRVRFPPPAPFFYILTGEIFIKTVFAKFLSQLGISADLLTIGGLFLALASGYFLYQGDFFTAGIVLLFSGLLDLMDGAVARVAGTQSKFGGILDSTLDRYGDAAVLGAASVYYGQMGRWTLSIVALVAWAGSFAVSYVRARAECEVAHCRVGFWERGERLVFIALALLLSNLGGALYLLAAGTNWTAFQRLAFAKFQTKDQPNKIIPFYLRTAPRNSWAYFLKVFLAVLMLILVRA